MTRACARCEQDFETASGNAKYCPDCRLPAHNERRRRKKLDDRECEECGATYSPWRQDQRFCSPTCTQNNANGLRRKPETAPLTRRCRNKDCIERFVPVNDQNWYHEPACRESTNLWAVEEILREEGAVYPEASHLELAKRAFGQKNQALRRVTQLTSLRDYLTFEIREFYDENPEYRLPKIPAPAKQKKARGDREVVVQFSDWQIGKWEDGFGVEATTARVEMAKDALAKIVQRQKDAGYRVRRIVLSFGGDMLEGCFIYRGQNVTGLDRTANTHRLTTQIRVVAHLMAEAAGFCASLAETVDVEVVGGNHGRTNGPNDFADPEDNFDLMAGMWASDLTSNTDRIRWVCHEKWWGGFESMGHYIVSFHGDQWQGKFERLDALLPQWIAGGVFDGQPKIVLTHHRHEPAMKQIAGASVFQNGTIDGGSAWYTKKYGRSSLPHQRILVVSEHHAPEADWAVQF